MTDGSLFHSFWQRRDKRLHHRGGWRRQQQEPGPPYVLLFPTVFYAPLLIWSNQQHRKGKIQRAYFFLPYIKMPNGNLVPTLEGWWWQMASNYSIKLSGGEVLAGGGRRDCVIFCFLRFPPVCSTPGAESFFFFYNFSLELWMWWRDRRVDWLCATRTSLWDCVFIYNVLAASIIYHPACFWCCSAVIWSSPGRTSPLWVQRWLKSDIELEITIPTNNFSL